MSRTASRGKVEDSCRGKRAGTVFRGVRVASVCEPGRPGSFLVVRQRRKEVEGSIIYSGLRYGAGSDDFGRYRLQ